MPVFILLVIVLAIVGVKLYFRFVGSQGVEDFVDGKHLERVHSADLEDYKNETDPTILIRRYQEKQTELREVSQEIERRIIQLRKQEEMLAKQQAEMNQ